MQFAEYMMGQEDWEYPENDSHDMSGGHHMSDYDWFPGVDFVQPGKEGAIVHSESAGSAGDEEVCGPAGLFYHPVTAEHLELWSSKSCAVNQSGGWTAHYVDHSGREYTLTYVDHGVVADTTQTTPTQKSEAPQKITFTPVNPEGAEAFVEKAWPSGSAPKISGSPREDPPKPVESAGADGSKSRPGSWDKHAILAAELRCALGNKPEGNKEEALDPKILQGMTLAEHIHHCKFYRSAEDFRRKIPDSISQELWQELVEVFIGYHAYNSEDPEEHLWTLRRMYAREFLDQHGLMRVVRGKGFLYTHRHICVYIYINICMYLYILHTYLQYIYIYIFIYSNIRHTYIYT